MSSCHSLQSCLLLPSPVPKRSFGFTDGLAYSALLKNELLGAGIEKVQDPQTEDRRLQPSNPEKKSLFTVSRLRCVKTSGGCTCASQEHSARLCHAAGAREVVLWLDQDKLLVTKFGGL